MDTNHFNGIPSHQDAEATIWILTGPNWAWFLQQALRHAERSILISMYLLSPHWQRSRPGGANLLSEICSAGRRLRDGGGICRAVMGSPGQNKYTASYNQMAAASMSAEGWNVRMMRTAVVLHEKIIIIDDEVTIIGSHNISKSSATTNLDTSIGIHSKTIATALKTNWWTRWNQGEAYGKNDKPIDPSEPTGTVRRANKPAATRIL